MASPPRATPARGGVELLGPSAEPPSAPFAARSGAHGVRSRRSGGAAGLPLPSPPVSGSGGARARTRRVPPVPFLGAEQRVQAYLQMCCFDESYVCFARDDEDKWLIYGFHPVETEDTWGYLLARFKDFKSGPNFHKLDAGSPQTTKIKSAAEFPVLLDEQFCKDNNYEACGTLLNIDLFLSNTPHFYGTVLNWVSTSESQDTLSEVLAGITSPIDTGFFCKNADSSTMYTVTSM